MFHRQRFEETSWKQSHRVPNRYNHKQTQNKHRLRTSTSNCNQAMIMITTKSSNTMNPQQGSFAGSPSLRCSNLTERVSTTRNKRRMIPTIRYQTRAPPPFDSCRYDKLHLLDRIRSDQIGLDFGGSKNPQKRHEARKEKTERRLCCCCGHMPDWYVAATHQSGILPKPLHVSSPQNSTNTEETHTNLPNNTTQLHPTSVATQESHRPDSTTMPTTVP